VRPSSLLALAVVALAAASALPAIGVARSSARPRASATASSHLQVIQVEYRLMLSRATVKAGPLGLEEIDRGMDPHDLRLRRGVSGTQIVLPKLVPRQRWDGVVHLKPGVYTLWCSLPEHAKLGMHATLRVLR
jgi:hypothetical protein